MSDLQPLLQTMIESWRAEDMTIPLGVDEMAIVRFELQYNVKVPDDMRLFYSTVNGMGGHYDGDTFSRFWPLEEIRPVSEYVAGFSARSYPNASEYFLFFDHSIDIFWYAIRLNSSTSSIDSIAYVDDRDFHVFCNSLVEFLRIYVNDSDRLMAGVP